MREYISLDAHKRYTFAEREEMTSKQVCQHRIEHKRGAIASYLADVEPGTPVAVEATGNWYWIVDEIEQAHCIAQLVHPRKAKLMMGCINKTDKLDVHGMNLLQRNGTLPMVWIAPPKIRDLRDLPRTRMFFCQERAIAIKGLDKLFQRCGGHAESVASLPVPRFAGTPLFFRAAPAKPSCPAKLSRKEGSLGEGWTRHFK